MEYTDTISYGAAENIMAWGLVGMTHWHRHRHSRRYRAAVKVYFFGYRMAELARDRFIRKQLGA